MRRTIILGVAIGIALFVIGSALCAAVGRTAGPTVVYCYASGPVNHNRAETGWANQSCRTAPARRGDWHLVQVIVKDERGVYDRLLTPRWRKWSGYQTGEVLLCMNKTNRYPIETDGVNNADDVTIGMWVRCEDYDDTYGKRY
jgi:hypothetical protein